MSISQIEVVCEHCGKTFRHRHKCYNRDAAESYTEWAKENVTICPECYKEIQRETERKRIEELTKNMPVTAELIGTDKQVKWANDIRRKALSFVVDRKPKQAFWDAVNSKTSAVWWIDNRDNLDNIYDFARLLEEK